MKQGKIVNAFKLLTKLYRIEGVPFGVSSILYNTKNRLQPYVDHQAEQEERMAEEISDGMNPDGSYKMDETQQKLFLKKLDDIQKTEVEFDHKPVRLQLTEEQAMLLGINGEKIDTLAGVMIIEVDGKTTADYTGGDSE